jgi:hypothetical protein
MNITNINTNLANYILTYNLPAKVYNWNFSWDTETEKVMTNIGFGTSNPQKQVDVAGDIKFSGNLYKNENLVGTWNKYTSNLYYTKGFVGINTEPAYELDILGSLRSDTRLTNSDIRLKENIVDEDLGIDYINELKPKIFNYKTDSNNIVHGLIAQDILNTSNIDIVNTDNNGYYNINLLSLISPIIKSIQQLSAKLNK